MHKLVALLLAGLPTSLAFLTPCRLRLSERQPCLSSVPARTLHPLSSPASLNSAVVFRRKSSRLALSMGEDVESATITEGKFLFDRSQAFYVKVEPPPSVRNAKFPPIVFLHGLGAHSVHFSKNMKEISMQTGACVYGLDMLGLGRSSKPANTRYGQEVWAWQVNCLVEEVIKEEKVFIVGHSAGGYVGMCYAADQPAKVAGLCVIGCAGQYGVIGPTRFYLPFLKLKSIARVNLVLLPEASERKCSSLLRKQLENMYVDKGAVGSARSSPAMTSKQISNNLVTGLSCIWRDDETFARGKEVFSSIVKADPGRKWKDLVSEAEVGYCGPLLAVWGRKDQINPPETLIDLKECRPDLELKWLDGGHCVHDEKPREFNELLVEWATRVQQENRSFPIPRAPRYKVLELWPF